MNNRVSVCVSVTVVHCVKTNKHIFKIFSPSVSHVILVFQHQTGWQYSDGDPLTGALNAGGVGRNRDSEPWRSVNAKCNVLSRDRPASWWHYSPVSDGVCFWRETTTKCMTRSLNVAPKTTEHHLIVRSGKWSEAKITMIKDCARGITLLKLTTDGHKASRGLSATAELLVY